LASLVIPGVDDDDDDDAADERMVMPPPLLVAVVIETLVFVESLCSLAGTTYNIFTLRIY
jgi:hypothetical protein